MDEEESKIFDEYVRKHFFRARLYTVIWGVIFGIGSNYFGDSDFTGSVLLLYICDIFFGLCFFYFFYTFYQQKYDMPNR
tara:strand:+ start:214 stop:450 length:237 start_codon:yes stop_codon:yes gene_type:complete